MKPRIVFGVCLALALGGCDWVDSAGKQPGGSDSAAEGAGQSLDTGGEESGDVDSSPPDTQPSPLNDTLEAPAALELVEQEAGRLVLDLPAGADVDGWVWSPQPVRQGALEVCADIDGFDMDLAASSLSAACTDSDACELDIAPDATAVNEVAFDLQAPRLRAPVGLVYPLNGQDLDGAALEVEAVVCLISVHEAPEAVDDAYVVQEGAVLVVSADDADNLLGNDVEDDDIRSQGLSVLAPTTQPNGARLFSLGEDGSFTYAFRGTNVGEPLVDTFDYTIFDGAFTSTATVEITVVADDKPPAAVSLPIPAQRAVTGIDFELDLNDLIVDPEGAALRFATDPAALPPSGALSLSPGGLLAGVPELGDEADYALVIDATDVTQTASFVVPLSVLDNEPVTAVEPDLLRASAGVNFSLNAARLFSDPERQSLVYSVEPDELYDDDTVQVIMNARTGLLSGRIETAGLFGFTLAASDGVTPSITVPLTVRVLP